MLTLLFGKVTLKGALDKYNNIPQLLTACWVLCSRMIYFDRNMNTFSIFYLSKSTSINTQYSLWDTLQMMLFTKHLIKWKRIGRISCKFWYWFCLKSSMELDIKRVIVILVQCPFNLISNYNISMSVVIQ